MNKLVNADCLEYMQSCCDNQFDYVITDPPYGIGEAAGKNKKRGGLAIAKDYGNREWDNKRPDSVYFKEMLRISKNQIIFGGNYFADLLPPSSCWIVWDKDNTGNCADCELVWTSFKTAVRLFKYRWNGMLQGNMKHKEKRVHPTQKPLPLMEWIINKYTEEKSSVIDPFMGSGTTGMACSMYNRDFTGIELEYDYFKIATVRIRQVESQITF